MTKTMNETFFELIQVALGVRVSLWHSPTAEEWKTLYDMAKKQSLVGICFAAVQRLSEDIRPPEMLYLTWMGMAAKIQQRNEVVNRQCVDLQNRLSTDGFRSCILKGQGIAELYGSLSALRQSGDIDIWVEGEQQDVLKWIDKVAPTNEVSFLHAEIKIYSDTSVEVHFHPAGFANIKKNKSAWQWYHSQRSKQMENSSLSQMTVPTPEFNILFLLNHAYSHLLSEGIGLRQFMDYYMVLQNVSDETGIAESRKMIKALGVERFAKGTMWVLGYVFGMNEDKMLWEPDEKEGRFLLDEIMTGGNFGHYSNDYHAAEKDSPIFRMLMGMKRNARFLDRYTADVLAIPFWRIWHYCWRKRHGYK